MKRKWPVLITILALMVIVAITTLILQRNSVNNQNITYDKPVIYLYPEQEQEVSVRLDYKGTLTVTYPEYADGWNVTARPDGTIINRRDGREYSYLFWEGRPEHDLDSIKEGFVVSGAETEAFLQRTLAGMGLMPREYNEFIVYWLPKMKNNNYNIIHFAGQEYVESAKLTITPEPDSILRIFMVFQPSDQFVELPQQKLETFNRHGFAVVEWGGSELP
ncbi:hypothetical protein PAECIP111893_00567 [Paenibacillus plantiphilus]|uniref:Uncharacterized protein n=1 Tax=Paenibacillus plantiphilus TaxID=2905650 RepID=A0ABN8G157_9BACL|nr:hypothetical protein [Paenibacillus plantiphilus]CAH1193842.1 hypothetical protein PAECIP111893_00567 [Paenibacillus plantiphilus]